MSTKSQTVKTCSKCGADLPVEATGGLCPRCLMEGALADTVPDTMPMSSRLVPSQADLAPHFPQLEILECLGRGGMGVVFKARQKSLNRLVALKLLAPDRAGDALFAKRFAKEAQALAALNHPNIVTIHDFGQAGGYCYLLMEYVDGATLRQAMRAAKFTPAQALAVVPQICDALQYAHEHGVVHRDIKPENLLLDREGRVKIADFGIAKMLNADAGGTGATETIAGGTPRYTAPEQWEGRGTDHRADIYSLGVVFYELLTGELPSRPIDPPSKKVAIDVRLDSVVLHALEENPDRRYQTVAEVKTGVEAASVPVRGKRTLAGLGIALAAACALAAAWTVLNRLKPAKPGAAFQPTAHSLQSTASQGPFTYTTNNGSVTITKYTGPGGDVTIPSTISGLPVNSIGPAAFQNCTNLTGITIPNSVSNLGLRAFEYCIGLTNVTIPGSVTETGDRAFRCCTGLANVTIQDGVTSVGFATFGGCTRLKSVVIPDSVTRIYGGAFRESSLPSVTIPDSVTSIGSGAFMKTPNLTSLHFKGNAPLLDNKDVFLEINTNATVYYLSGTTGWGKEFGGWPTAEWNPEVPFTYSTNNGVVTITKYTGPGGAVAVPRLINGLPVAVIGDRAFNGCGGLTSVILPDSVSRIEPYAFGKCLSLASVEIPASVTRIGEWAFNGCGALTSVAIPVGVSNIEDRVFFDCGSLASVVLPSGATNIGAFAFGKCSALTSVAIPSGVSRIGAWAFSGCSALTSVGIPVGLSNIEDRVFFDCSSLASVVIPSGATNIGMFAFGKCRSLTSVAVPSGVASIGTWAFSDCSHLDGIYFAGNAPCLGSDIFLHTQKATVYYRPGTKGWGKEFGGRLTAVWDGIAQAATEKGGLYMVVDLSGGTNATRYPVTYLDAVPAGGWTDEYKTDKLVLRKIKPGTFMMGSPTNEIGHDTRRETTRHEVVLTKAFYLGVFELTQRQWELVMGTRPSQYDNAAFYASRPVERVSYYMIRENPDNTDDPNVNWPINKAVNPLSFMGRLCTKTALAFDLPSEAQWEYACRAGTRTALNSGRDLTEERICPNMSEVGRYRYNANIGHTDPSGGPDKVGCRLPNRWGLYDMHGNIYEFCLDWYGAYPTHLVTNPVGNAEGRLRTIRGESWNNIACFCRSAYRGCLYPNTLRHDYGFRVACASQEDVLPSGSPTVLLNAAPMPSVPFTYTVNKGAITITKYTGPDSEVVVPETINGQPVTAIERLAFVNDTRVTSIELSRSLTRLGRDTFKGCLNLISIRVAAENPAYCSSEDGVVFSKDKTALVRFPPGKGGEYTVPSGVTDISDCAFESCNNLTALTIPDSVSRLGVNCFVSCANLSWVFFKGNKPNTRNETPFANSLKATVYYRFGKIGWGTTFGAQRTAKLDDLFANPGEVDAFFNGTKKNESQNAWSDSFSYVLDAAGRATINGLREHNVCEVTIPGSLDGHPVVGIGGLGLQVCTNSVRVAIPASVTNISRFTFNFYNMSPSISVDPANLVYASANGVLFDKRLSTLIRCPADKAGTYTVPASVTRIGEGAFAKCASLDRIIFPDGLKDIQSDAFSGCTGLNNLTIPQSVTNVDPCAFEGGVTVEKKNSHYASADGVLFDKSVSTLIHCPVDKTGFYTIPASVTLISREAFQSCTGLARIHLPAGLKEIQSGAFLGCEGLKDFAIPDAVTNIGDTAFHFCNNLTSLMVAASSLVYSSRDGVLLNMDQTRLIKVPAGRAGRYVVPPGVTEIRSAPKSRSSGWARMAGGVWFSSRQNAFDGCGLLTEVVIPSSVTNVGGATFANCEKMEAITVDLSNRSYCSLDGVLFDKGKTEIVSVPRAKTGRFEVPGSVGQLAKTEFAGCNLSEVDLREGIGSLSHDAFGACRNLKHVSIPATMTNIDEQAFWNCTNLVSITVDPANNYYASQGGVLYDKGLTGVLLVPTKLKGTYVIPETVTRMDGRTLTRVSRLGGNDSFADCTELTEITVPCGVKSIQLDGCVRLESVHVAANHPTYESLGGVLLSKGRRSKTLVFYPSGKTGASYRVPDGVTDITVKAFTECTGLTAVTLPASILYVTESAFTDCLNLREVRFEGDCPRGNNRDNVFPGSTNVTVYYRSGTKGWGPTFGGRPTAEWVEKVQDVSDNGGLYMVVALSGGTNATRYPVTYLDAVPTGGWTDEYKTDKLVLRKIEPGTFMMGSPTNELARDPTRETQHLVTLTSPFYIGVFEVTQRQWERVTGGRPSYFNNPSGYATRPVESVSYTMIGDPSSADTFMARLRARTGLRMGLPSDAQWEYACRAGCAASFGNGRNLTAIGAACPELASVARYRHNSGAAETNCPREVGMNMGTAAVGSYVPNAWGLFDMHGNVYEWTEDWWAPCTSSAALTDPQGPETGRLKTVRGGSWNAEGTHCRAAARPGSRNLTNASNTFGFRICVPVADAHPLSGPHAEMENGGGTESTKKEDHSFTCGSRDGLSSARARRPDSRHRRPVGVETDIVGLT